jgi:hypothetical protein
MAHPRLRILSDVRRHSDETSTSEEASARAERVSVRLGEFLPILADAVRHGRSWPLDFEDDEITIPLDLYEVMLAYQRYRRAS